MFTFDDIKDISKDEFAKLSTENKELVLKILSEYRDYGESQTLKDLWEVDYEEIPVTIDEFICNDKYLGKVTGHGELIYPFWRERYREIFDYSKNYEEMVFTGAIGIGKTRTGVICLCYLLYRLMCLKNPNAYFNLLEGDKITIFFLNITLDLAKGVGYNTMHEFLRASPWFMERGTVTGVKNLVYNPPKNIIIEYGSSGGHGLGKAIFAAMLDEVDFKKSGLKGTSALDASNAIMDAYHVIKGRISSRFIKKGILYGKLFLVSSKKSEHDFLEQYVKKMYNPKMLVIDEPQWVVKPKGTFSDVTFPVAVGNRSLKSMVLPDDLTEEQRNAYIKQGYRIIDVPENYRDEFKLDIYKALMDKAGISILGSTSFFNYDMFSKCYVEDYKNPFIADILTIGMNDELKIQDFIDIDKIPPAVKYMPQFIHIDASLTGDKTGISDVGVSGLKETKQYNGADEFVTTEMMYKHIFSVDILAPHGTEISFEKTRQFIYYLKSCGFNIIGVSLDGFQSADTKQILITQGYDATVLSMDRSPEGYLSLRSAMNDRRIGLIQIELLEKELVQLQRDIQTGKLDHPADGCFTLDTMVQATDNLMLFNDPVTIQYLYDNQTNKQFYTRTINEETGLIEINKIVKVFKTKEVDFLYSLQFIENNTIHHVIKVTPNHRFMMPDNTYMEIKDIPLGTKVKSVYGSAILIDKQPIRYDKPIPVYDIEVENNHNFTLYNGVVVHNSKDMSDSLAGALWNATLHKQDLIDSMQLFESATEINSDYSQEQAFIDDMQKSLSAKNSKIAASTLDSLLDSYGGGNILSW